MRKTTVISAMLLGFCVFGSEAIGSTTIQGPYETAWTEGYYVEDKAEFDIEVKGGEGTSDNIITIFESSKTKGFASPREEVGASYKEYMVIQTDCYGWGFGKNCSLDGNPISYYNNVDDYDKDGDVWDDFVDIMKDAHIDATVAKTSGGIEVRYYVTGKNGNSFTYKAQTMVDTSDGLYVVFACKNSEITVARVDEEPAAPESEKMDEEVVDIVEEEQPLASKPAKKEEVINKVTQDIIINEETTKKSDLSELEKVEVQTIIYKSDEIVDIDFEEIPKAAPEGRDFVEKSSNDSEKIYKVTAVVAIVVMLVGVVIIGKRDIANVKKRV